jgi:hypothetical protein
MLVDVWSTVTSGSNAATSSTGAGRSRAMRQWLARNEERSRGGPGTTAAAFVATGIPSPSPTDGSDQMLPIRPEMPFDVIAPNAL